MNPKSAICAGLIGVLGLLVAVGDGSVTGLGLLSPLIPVAQITGHAGLWAHGLTSAALLKLKAAGALAGLFFLSGRGIELNVGNDNAGWGWEAPSSGWQAPTSGWGWESKGWESRKKRDVQEIQRRDDVNFYEPSLDEVLAYDQMGCGLRFVCELSATPLNQLREDERMILELFGRDDSKSPLDPAKSSQGKLSYNYASILGATAKDGARSCARVYGQCPHSRTDIVGLLRQANV